VKGIILAGGRGTRLYPVTRAVSKQILPVYDKPMIYYPLSVLMLAGIREVLIISTPNDLPIFKKLLGDGSNIGMRFEYKVQPNPDGLAHAFILGESFLNGEDACLILGDNIFYGHDLTKLLTQSIKNAEQENKATVFGYYVNDPERYGVAEFDSNNSVVSIEEKPLNPKSNFAIVGLYFYPKDVVKKSKSIKPSSRGELEITALNQFYLNEDRLKVKLMGRGFAWFDTGTHDSLIDASHFIQTIEKRQGLKIACIEEIAYVMKFISKEDFIALTKSLSNSLYGRYLENILKS
jgi:glucose-1-phosphate thymidylyltransferase